VKKLPVLAILSRTFGFLLGDLPTIVRLSWLPLAIAAGISFYLGGQAIDAIVAAKGNPSAGAGAPQADLLAGTISFVTNAIVVVALLRVVLYGDRKPGWPAWISLGITEGRFMLVYILLVIAGIAGVIGTVLIFSLFAAAAAQVPGMALVIDMVAFGLLVGVVWVMVKLYLVPAVVVAENTLGVERAWALMRGNAFRMFVILLVAYVPLAIMGVMLSLAILGADMPPAPDFTLLASGKLKPEDAQKMIEAWQTGLLAAARMHWTEFAILNYVGAIIGAALVAGIAGNAYLELAGDPPHNQA
jgi:hypothetical protein